MGKNNKNQGVNHGVVERFSLGARDWLGSTASLITHTIIFLGAIASPLFGFDLERVLIVLTTILSLEAIYLAIFIQMTVNSATKEIEEISEDIDEIQEDVDEIQEDVDEIQEDVEDIQEDDISDGGRLEKIENSLLAIVKEIEELKKTKS